MQKIPLQLSFLAILILLITCQRLSISIALAESSFEVVPQVGHLVSATAVGVSSDGMYALSGGGDKTIKLWATQTSTLLRTFRGHTQSITSVAFSPRGHFVLSGSRDKSAKLWDAQTGKLLQTFLGHEDAVRTVAFSPSAEQVLTGSYDTTVRLWEAQTGAIIHTMNDHNSRILSVAFSRQGDRIASSSNDRTVKIWNAQSGQLISTLPLDNARAMSVEFSPDGNWLLWGGVFNGARRIHTMELRDSRTGALVHDFGKFNEDVYSAAFSPTGLYAVSISPQEEDGVVSNRLRIWEAATGRLIQQTLVGDAENVAFLPGDQQVLMPYSNGTLRLLDVATGQLVKRFGSNSASVATAALSPNGANIVSASRYADDYSLKLWDTSSARLVHAFKGHTGGVTSVVFSPTGDRILSGSFDKTVKLWDTRNGEVIMSFNDNMDEVVAVAFSPDGKRAFSGEGGRDKMLREWNVITGKLVDSASVPDGKSVNFIKTVAYSPNGERWVTGSDVLRWNKDGRVAIRFPSERSSNLAFSQNGKAILTAEADAQLVLRDTKKGSLLRRFKGHNDGPKTIAIEDWSQRIYELPLYPVTSVSIAPIGDFVVSGDDGGAIKLWNVGSGEFKRSLSGHLSSITSLAVSPKGDRVVSSSLDSTIRIWNATTGNEVVSMLASPKGDWLALTPDGFFSAGGDVEGLLSVVRGFEAVGINQLWQSLHNPDLVREALAGDLNGEVKRASKVINLSSVIASGPAPTVAILSPKDGTSTADETVTIEAKIAGREGKGVGRIEWRVNGVTAGVMPEPEGAGPEYLVRRTLALRQDKNEIEVVAYNALNLLASTAAKTTVTYTGPADTTKPRLHVLAIGINDYNDTRFRKLDFAKSDANAFSRLMDRVGRDEKYYTGTPDIVTLPEAQATRDGIERAIGEMAKSMELRDTFILFAAAHGTSRNGRFYLIPHGFRSGADALESTAIGQTQLQEWLANRIKAQRVLVLLDTCASGALVGGAERSRVDVPASEAAVGRLHEATGRPVLTAAATGQGAVEGYLAPDGTRYGVFTYAVLEAFRKGDNDGSDEIDLVKLATHVQRRVPEIAASIRAMAYPRGAVTKSAEVDEIDSSTVFRQSARLGSHGDNFVIGRRME